MVLYYSIALFESPFVNLTNEGRWSVQHPEEQMRYMLENEFRITHNLDRIMYTTDKIQKADFYRSFRRSLKVDLD